MLQVKNLGIYQDQRWLWRNFNLQIAAGEVVGIQAPSGYGKTTLGRVLAGWQAADEGEILYQDQPLPSKGYSQYNCYRNILSKPLIQYDASQTVSTMRGTHPLNG